MSIAEGNILSKKARYFDIFSNKRITLIEKALEERNGAMRALIGIFVGIVIAFVVIALFPSSADWARDFLRVRMVATQVTKEDVELLTLNIYFHNGSTNTDMSKKAIMAVVLNRLEDRDHYWPRTIRGVIRGGKERGENCDFAWGCDSYSDVPEDVERYQRDRQLIERWLTEYCAGVFKDPTNGATWFINKRRKPPRSWPKLEATKTYGQYTFYRYPS